MTGSYVEEYHSYSDDDDDGDDTIDYDALPEDYRFPFAWMDEIDDNADPWAPATPPSNQWSGGEESEGEDDHRD